MESALQAWSASCPNRDKPSDPSSQRAWDEITSRHIQETLLEAAVGVDEARLRAASRPESGLWLQTFPSPHMGTLLDADPLRVAAALRLGCDICVPHRCVCGAWVEANGHHGLACTRCSGRIPRHQAINEIIRRAVAASGVPCILEPPGLSRADGKRPDGATMIPWRKGKCLLWDATCVSTYAASHIHGTQRVAGSAAETAAKTKHAKYACLESSHLFVPIAVETAGPWGFEAKSFIRDLGKRLREQGNHPRSGLYLAQQKFPSLCSEGTLPVFWGRSAGSPCQEVFLWVGGWLGR